jgi:hypothetical protein
MLLTARLELYESKIHVESEKEKEGKGGPRQYQSTLLHDWSSENCPTSSVITPPYSALINYFEHRISRNFIFFSNNNDSIHQILLRSILGTSQLFIGMICLELETQIASQSVQASPEDPANSC